MATPPTADRARQSSPSEADRLDSWKEIATYMGRALRTVQRWESEHDLPIHRHTDQKNKGSVFAFRAEIDAWWGRHRDQLAGEGQTAEEPTTRRISRGVRWWTTGGAKALLAAAAIALIVGVVVGSRFWAPASPEAPELLHAIPLTSYEGSETHPTLSPDGNQVAFSWNGPAQDNYDIYVKVIGSEKRLRLTSDPAVDFSPAWSPDGQQIAFRRDSRNDRVIYLISPLGGPERKVGEIRGRTLLRFDFFWRGDLAWSPDSEFLLFAESSSPGEPWSIDSLSIETGENRRLTSPPAGAGDWYPALSPDGQTLAFVRHTTGLTAINLAAGGGGEPRQLTSVPATWPQIGKLAWTPDGREIVFAQFSPEGGDPTLWRISPSGGAAQQLTGPAEKARFPVISQQGDRLVYQRELYDVNIWRYDLSPSKANRKPPQKLISSTQGDSVPRFSPDGKRISFSSDRSGSDEIWICDRDGSNLFQLTFSGGAVHSWSPDGQHLAFDGCLVKGDPAICVVSVQGGSPRPLTTARRYDYRPSWSPDGRWIYFSSHRTGRRQIWKVAAEGGEAVQVTQEGGHHPVASPDGRYVYYGKGRYEHGLWRVPVDGGEEGPVIPWLENAGAYGQWRLADEGVYFIDSEKNPSSESKWSLKFFRFDSRQVTRVADLEQPPHPWAPSDISPDGKSFLYAQIDHGGSDLMLVENFR